MTPSNTTWVPLDVAEGIVEQAIREVLGARFFAGTVAEVTVEAGYRMQELRAELGRLGASHCDDGPVTRNCPLECLRLPARRYNLISRMWPDPPSTVGELLSAARTGRLSELRNFGTASHRTVRKALEAAGFGVDHNHPPLAETNC